MGIPMALITSPLHDKFQVNHGEHLSPIDFEGEDDYRNYFKRTDFLHGSVVNPTYDKDVLQEIIHHTAAVTAKKHTWVALVIPQHDNTNYNDYLALHRIPEIHLNNPLQHTWGWDDQPRPPANFKTRIVCIGLFAPHTTKRVYEVHNNCPQGYFEISQSWVNSLQQLFSFFT